MTKSLTCGQRVFVYWWHSSTHIMFCVWLFMMIGSSPALLTKLFENGMKMASAVPHSRGILAMCTIFWCTAMSYSVHLKTRQLGGGHSMDNHFKYCWDTL